MPQEERNAYESSIKYYRDMNKVVTTAEEKRRMEGREVGREEEKFNIVRAMNLNFAVN